MSFYLKDVHVLAGVKSDSDSHSQLLVLSRWETLDLH